MKMKVNAIITGATGMVGKGVLLTCLENENVDSILLISRKPIGIKHPKLKEIIPQDFYDLSQIENQLSGYNACFFCLGISAFRMKEVDYKWITYDLTLSIANTLVALNPDMVFCYVSGQGTDTSEKKKIMWARVKGSTENALLALPFKAAYMFRPGFIQRMKGVRSSTSLYNGIYTVINPILPAAKSLFPNSITSNYQIGMAMINCVLFGYEKHQLGNTDINLIAEMK